MHRLDWISFRPVARQLEVAGFGPSPICTESAAAADFQSLCHWAEADLFQALCRSLTSSLSMAGSASIIPLARRLC